VETAAPGRIGPKRNILAREAILRNTLIKDKWNMRIATGMVPHQHDRGESK
jgi:hypothetical protein